MITMNEQLLKDVQEAEGTRIDGMGMQGHYQTSGSPTVEEFARAARAYAEIVGQVQITELDMKASSRYDGTAATRDEEFALQGERYRELYDTVKNLREEGVNITNITLWGVVDKNSWLQTFNTVGGAADGQQKQCPLLFDDDYMVKPAFWAFADSSRLDVQNQEEPVVEESEEPSAEGSVEPSSEELTESSTEPAADTALTAQPEQSEAAQEKSSGKGLYGVLAVCGILAAGIAGAVIIRRRRKDKK